MTTFKRSRTGSWSRLGIPLTLFLASFVALCCMQSIAFSTAPRVFGDTLEATYSLAVANANEFKNLQYLYTFGTLGAVFIFVCWHFRTNRLLWWVMLCCIAVEFSLLYLILENRAFDYVIRNLIAPAL